MISNGGLSAVPGISHLLALHADVDRATCTCVVTCHDTATDCYIKHVLSHCSQVRDVEDGAAGWTFLPGPPLEGRSSWCSLSECVDCVDVISQLVQMPSKKERFMTLAFWGEWLTRRGVRYVRDRKSVV